MILCSACSTENVEGVEVCVACGNALSDGSVAAAPWLPVGAELHGGAYRVGKKLGQGGFAITYLGSEIAVPRAVAIKEFFPDGLLP